MSGWLWCSAQARRAISPSICPSYEAHEGVQVNELANMLGEVLAEKSLGNGQMFHASAEEGIVFGFWHKGMILYVFFTFRAAKKVARDDK